MPVYLFLFIKSHALISEKLTYMSKSPPCNVTESENNNAGSVPLSAPKFYGVVFGTCLILLCNWHYRVSSQTYDLWTVVLFNSTYVDMLWGLAFTDLR